MKIVFIGQKGIPAQTGGVERYVENLALNLAQQGQEVLVYSRKNYSHDLTEYKNIKIIPLPNISGKNFEAISHTFLACLDLIRRPVDIINFQSVGPASLIWLARLLKPRTPIVFTFHCRDYQHKKWGRLARWYLYFGEKVGCLLANRVVTISQELKKYTFDTYHKSAVYIPNGATVKERMPVQEIRRWGLEEGNYFVSISRLVRHKGIHHLITAYKKLLTDKKLVIVGDGAYTNDYVRELHELAGDDQRIIFTGNQTGRTLAELYSNAYAFVQASESEGLSIALLEAMSYGLACLASDIEANQEALSGTGCLFKTNDVNDLYLKMKELLTNQELAKLGVASLERVKKEYSWLDIAKKVLGLYQEIK
ncbi:MAG: glycosyltransferase family 4 protein [Patescibacteria group bacterium]